MIRVVNYSGIDPWRSTIHRLGAHFAPLIYSACRFRRCVVTVSDVTKQYAFAGRAWILSDLDIAARARSFWECCHIYHNYHDSSHRNKGSRVWNVLSACTIR